MTFRLGLTGSIGMGKSTAGEMFAELGHPVWDADAAVHRLYKANGKAVAGVRELFPGVLAKDGSIDRSALRDALQIDPSGYQRLESIVHPLVHADRTAFEIDHPDAPLIVFDIPLLFETDGQRFMDGTAVVSVDADTQRARVLERPGMTVEQFEAILERQMPDAQKRGRADWVIPSDTMENARAAINAICKEILDHA